MRVKTRKLMYEFSSKKPAVFIDYLTLVQSSELNRGNTHLQLAVIMESLKRW
ncbi:hypothetical protein H5P36_22885 [Bacillus sp. APMAM]|nr:hypothetical protein [Bacillus sp. APMAM]